MYTSNNSSFQGAGGVGGLIAMESASTRYFYHYDGNGNVTELTDASGATVASYRYTAFGQLRSSSGTAAEANEYRFSTKPYDSVSQCYYYGYRFYNPEMGRWLNRDPIGEAGGLNLYAMVGNDAVNQWDLLGMKLETFLIVSYFTESCVPVASISFTAPNKLWKYLNKLISTASFIQGLIGTLERTDSEKISIPDCYVLEKDPATGSAREEFSYDVMNWRFSMDTAFSVEVCGRVKETIEKFWIPDPEDECCK